MNNITKAMVLTALFGVAISTQAISLPVTTIDHTAKIYKQQVKVIIFTMNGCKYCEQVKSYMSSHGIKYIEKNISNKDHLEELNRLSDANGMPQTVINGEVFVGTSAIDELKRLGV
mgnify:CR=1 FL=1